MLRESRGEYDINLNLLQISERQDDKEVLFANLQNKDYFKSISVPVPRALSQRIEFDTNDP